MCTSQDRSDGWECHPGGLCIRYTVTDGQVTNFEARTPPGQRLDTAALRSIRVTELVARKLPSRTRPAAIVDPGGYRKPDSFYEEVAAVYTAEVAAGNMAPAQTLARVSDVPVPTVHRWLREARARGCVLPTAARGRRSGGVNPPG